MDLSQLSTTKKANEGVKFPVLHPQTGKALTDEGDKFKVGDKTVTGEGKELYITIVGRDSDTYRGLLNRKMINDRKATKTNESDDSDTPYSDIVNRRAANLATCTVDCYLIYNGAVIDGSTPKDQLEEMYRNVDLISESMEINSLNRENFMQG